MNILAGNFARKRWLDFRNGHSIYLAFVLTFVNFILITYNFAVQKVSFLSNLLGHDLLFFTILFIVIYIPSAMLIGYWHRRQQYRVENETMLAENWIWAWFTSYQIRLIQGKSTPEETKEVMTYCENILRRHKMERFIHKDSESESAAVERIDSPQRARAMSSAISSDARKVHESDN